MKAQADLRNALLAVSLGILSFTAGGVAVAQVPFTCTGLQAYATQEIDTVIYGVTDNLIFAPVCPSLGIEVNNLCYNSADGLLYGVELKSNGNHGVVKIDATCSVTSVPINGLPTGRRFDAGECLPDGSKMLVNIGGIPIDYYMVDFASATATHLPMAAGSSTGFVHDWAYNPGDGKFYGGDNSHGHLAVLELLPNPSNPTSVKRTDSALAGLPAGAGSLNAYGGAWFNTDLDRLFLHRNVGEVYEVDLSGPTVIGSPQSAPSSTRNDSTRCSATPICDQAYFIQDQNAVVYRCDPSTPQLTCQQICGPLGREFNNAGYRAADGLIYAVELDGSNNKGIVRMDPDNACAIETATVAGLPTGVRFDAGDVTPDGTTLYINIAGNPMLYRVDLTAWPTLTAIPLGISGDAGNVHDWAYNPADGKLYGGDDTHGELASLDVGATPVARIDVMPNLLPTGTAFGGAWFNAAGRLVLHRNNGEIYEVDLAGPSIVQPVWPERGSPFNEGAVCVQ